VRLVGSVPTQKKPIEKRIARAGPPLPEALQLLAPLAPNLENLNLGYNKLGGTITEHIAVFTKLTVLTLWGMGLSGAIPEPIGNLTNLQTLNLGSNALSGAIPESIGNLTNLQHLYLNGNALTGTEAELRKLLPRCTIHI